MTTSINIASSASSFLFNTKILINIHIFFIVHQKRNRKNACLQVVVRKIIMRSLSQTTGMAKKGRIFVAIVRGRKKFTGSGTHWWEREQNFCQRMIVTSNCCQIWLGHFFSHQKHEQISGRYMTVLHPTALRQSLSSNKFRGSVVSRGSEFVWSTHSPDFNHNDFYFWKVAKKQVYLQKPESSLKNESSSFLRSITDSVGAWDCC